MILTPREKALRAPELLIRYSVRVRRLLSFRINIKLHLLTRIGQAERQCAYSCGESDGPHSDERLFPRQHLDQIRGMDFRPPREVLWGVSTDPRMPVRDCSFPFEFWIDSDTEVTGKDGPRPMLHVMR